MSPNSRTVLYYPTIEIPTGSWLRQSLLYWDRIGSIVPRTYDDWQDSHAVARYSDKMRYLYDEGVFKPYNPDSLVNEGQAMMRKELTRIISSPSFRKLLAPISERTLDVKVYRQKVSDSIATLLINKRLAERHPYEPAFMFEKNTAFVLMSLLAKYLASVSEEITIPSTDDKACEHINFRSSGFREKDVAISTVLQNVLPVPAPTVTLREVIEFRRHHKTQLEEFRVELERFEAGIHTCENERQVQEQARGFSARLDLEIGKLERQFRRSIIPTVMSSLQSFIKPTSPSLLGAALVLTGKATSLTTVPVEWVLGGAVGAGFIEVSALLVNKWEARENRIDESPFSYLYRAKKRLRVMRH